MKIRDEAFQYYFYFIQERMNLFWKRYEGVNHLLTDDKILATYKFTNVYRAQDRISQYLIKDVIYGDNNGLNEEDVLLKILIFKVFNKVETWEYLTNNFGAITVNRFNVDILSRMLADRISSVPIFNSAYMMTGTHEKYSAFSSKHEKWLRMIEKELIKEGRLKRITLAKSLEDVYKILLECSFIGDFLAYQYAIDFNYSDVINFDENSFVKAGIGAVRGLKKCFITFGSYSFEDCIRYTQDNFTVFQERYGYNNFRSLFGREPKLIDIQNCFCECDKYLRAKLPELHVDNTRIKQKFRPKKEAIAFFFPPKWNLNDFIKECTTTNTKELTLF
ncbi:nucleotide kinase domain-containing protein [Paraflavisolibacter sp. H34]|uniref:nucleotide kinase domain-containing protein n=1 Tax=Huijunlia imazamoxiresistens TaxID=3127457 RepID=UPI0030191CEB